MTPRDPDLDVPPDEAATTRHRPSMPPRLDAVRYHLTVVEGPDRGVRFTIDSGLPRVFLGTSSACQLRLTDPLISRRHAALEILDGALRVTDLASTNGTTANGVGVVEVNLWGDELIRLGATALHVDARTPSTAVPLTPATSFGRVLGASVEMRKIFPLCERVASSELPVLIEGETGTGKEVLAESIHEVSARESGAFVVFDCTTIAPSLMEPALFGHERGAFTGAVESQRGVFEQTVGGTLLIDEIGELEIGLQAKLLRAIERAEICRVGGTRWIKCDVRVIAATRRDLEQEISVGRFRDDLFYRLAVARIELPPLRRRHGDVALLTRHFWTQLGGADDPPAEVLRRFEQYDWPGNVRELYNAVAARIALGDLARIDALKEPSDRRAGASLADDPGGIIERILRMDLPLARAKQQLLGEFERRYVDRMLAQHQGSVVKAAAAAGIARRYFQILNARRGGGKKVSGE
jgi:two-component system response regulator HydG